MATRGHIVAIATELFTGRGYEATSIETVLETSGVSRGALYHHFESKEALYIAVLEVVEARIADTTAAASRGLRDPREALRAGCNAWIDLSRDPAVRQIVLLDAPAVIGWQKWREIDARFAFGQVRAALTNAAKSGRLPLELVDTLAHILLAALLEIALVIARSSDAQAATRRGRAALDVLLDAIVGESRAIAFRNSKGSRAT
ncbi:MAG TPA: TetR/AcrR family transcriptional regulator [Acetobacteraceae bacterium]|jgi:AcrR family transcriptional regulator